MPAIRGTRRTLLSGNETGALLTQQRTDGSLYILDMQEPTGDVSIAWNKAVALGRNIASQIYTDYSEGTGWSNLGDNVAHCDGTGGATSFLGYTAPGGVGKSFEVVFTVSNYVAGSLNIVVFGVGSTTLGDNGTITETVVAGTGVKINISANNSFEGDVDLKLVTVKQTNIAASSEFPGAELFDNPGNPFAFTAGVIDDWTIRGNDANQAITEVAEGEFHADSPTVGGGYLNLWRSGGSDTAFIHQTLLTVGKRYRVILDIDGVNSGSVIVKTNIAFTKVFTTSGVKIFEFITDRDRLFLVTDSDPTDITVKSFSITLANPLNASDTGTTPGVAGNGRGVQYVKSSDAVTTVIDFYSAELNSVISWDTGSMIMVASSDTWAAGVDYLVNMAVDADNGVSIRRDGTDLIVSYEADGTEESITIASGSPTGLFGIGLTWDTAGGGAVKGLYQGAQSGATQTIANTLIGNLASTLCTIFSLNTTPGNVWAGNGAYLDIRAEVISVAEFSNICRSWGVS